MESIWDASLAELKQGFVETAEHYTCLCCGKPIEKGIIYPEDGVLYEAGKYTRRHIEREHGSVFAHLIGLGKSATGLTEIQARLLELFALGRSDAEIQKELGIGSTSTIRNHRFVLKEKERQARVFLAIMELLRAAPAEALPPAQPQESERERVVRKYFPFGPEGPLKSLAMKEKQKRIVLGAIAARFEPARLYTEAEVNRILETVFADQVTLRRLLVDYGFLDRRPDGSQYWRSDAADEWEESHVTRRDELKRLAKEIKTEAGIFQIKNERNGKVWVEKTRNLKTINGQQFQLDMDVHRNKTLQQDWKEFGKDAFTVTVLEILEKPEAGYFDEADALQKLKVKWVEQLQPFGERGYNRIKEEE